MSLDDLNDAVDAAYADLGDDQCLALDRETRTELALLQAGLGPEDADDLLKRAVHLLFQSTVETGRLDAHLRREYGVTYDEYLSGMSYDEMTGAPDPPENDGRRYQF
jgi:hypothetical protein